MPASQFKPQSDRIKKKNKRAKRVIRFRGSAHKAAGLYLPYGKTSGRKSAKAAAFIGLKKFHSLASGRERDRPKFDINFFSPFFFPPFPPPLFRERQGEGKGRKGRRRRRRTRWYFLRAAHPISPRTVGRISATFSLIKKFPRSRAGASLVLLRPSPPSPPSRSSRLRRARQRTTTLRAPPQTGFSLLKSITAGQRDERERRMGGGRRRRVAERGNKWRITSGQRGGEANFKNPGGVIARDLEGLPDELDGDGEHPIFSVLYFRAIRAPLPPSSLPLPLPFSLILVVTRKRVASHAQSPYHVPPRYLTSWSVTCWN